MLVVLNSEMLALNHNQIQVIVQFCRNLIHQSSAIKVIKAGVYACMIEQLKAAWWHLWQALAAGGVVH